jgi:hypothetical protein
MPNKPKKPNKSNKPKKTKKMRKPTQGLRHTSKNKFTFNETEYKSNDGMLTTIWGPSMWHYLHTMSFNYPIEPTAEDKRHYKNFIYNLQYVLPCGKCRKNLKKNLKEYPLQNKHMLSRDAFSRYVYGLHEQINTMLHKTSGLSYEDVRERYEHFRARCATSYDKMKEEINKLHKNKDKDKTKENGCTVPLYGEKSKCVLHIVPQAHKCETLQIDNKCIKKKIDI